MNKQIDLLKEIDIIACKNESFFCECVRAFVRMWVSVCIFYPSVSLYVCVCVYSVKRDQKLRV